MRQSRLSVRRAKLYLDRLKKFPHFARKYAWPMTRVVENGTPTSSKLRVALEDGDFGRCVFRHDNNVVDYQTVSLDFDNGTEATLTMTAFSPAIYRTITVRGSLGTLEGKFEDGKLTLSLFGKKPRVIRTARAFIGHGGGDIGLISALVNGKTRTDIMQSLQSHVLAYAAEQSRLNAGVPVDVKSLRRRIFPQPRTNKSPALRNADSRRRTRRTRCENVVLRASIVLRMTAHCAIIL